MNKNIDRPVVTAADVFGVRSTVQAAPRSALRATGTAATGTDPARHALAARIRGAEAINGARAARAAKAAAATQAPTHPHPTPTATPASTPAATPASTPAPPHPSAPAPARPVSAPAPAQPAAPVVAAAQPFAPEDEQASGGVRPVGGQVATYAEDLAGPVLGGGDAQPVVAATGPLAFPAVPECVHGPQQARTHSL
ncbi:hypothetical protein AB0958_26840 [Streptomyces sp. NPDC006655]|uniref:hypothetical protein n=1 Tax=Streptomyces sp. NPDC006655 TaxID=3156898 RepID=UPI003452383D